MSLKRGNCGPGLEESLPLSAGNVDNLLPSSAFLKKARRLAVKTKATSACSMCKSIRRKCGDYRPCPRCSAKGLSAECADEGKKEQCLVVERPLKFSITSQTFEGSNLFPSEQLNGRWSVETARSYWSIGFKLTDIVRLFNAVPQRISSAIETLLIAVGNRRRMGAGAERYVHIHRCLKMNV